MRASFVFILAAVVCLCVSGIVRADDEQQKFGFGADVQKMMHIIVHSLYQNPDIFVRELISNSADALTKQRVASLKNDVVSDLPYEVKISADKEARTVTIADTGISMTRDEMITNLGSLGFSGTKKFLDTAASGQSANKLIGQFGVGFYSVFLAGDKVQVVGKSDNSTNQYVFESVADGTFSVKRDPRGKTLERGTEVTLFLKPDAEHYTNTDNLRKIISKYSEFIDFPIYLKTCKKEKVPVEKPEGEEPTEDGEEDKEEFIEQDVCDWEHVNEQKPIWLRNPDEVDEEDYHGFYKAISKDLDPPMYYNHFSAEGEVEFKSILYVPAKAPFNVHDPSAGLMTNVRLYVRRVFITDEFKDLLPRYLNFIRGVVDSDDLPLNVSREVLQESRLIKVIRKRLTRKVLTMISDIVSRDEANEKKKKAKDAKGKEDAEKRKAEAADEEIVAEEDVPKNDEDEEDQDVKKDWEPEYPKFWAEYGRALRLGVIEDPANKNKLTKLLRYHSSKSNGSYTTFEDYVDRMHESQKGIFYITGESTEKIEESPLLEWALAEDIEVLFLDEPIDEFVVAHITEYANHKLIDMSKATRLKDETRREELLDDARKERWEPFMKWVKQQFSKTVEKVVLSKRLLNTPCVLVAPHYGVTASMQRIMKAQALTDSIKHEKKDVKRVLEINPRHAVVDELRRRWEADKEDPLMKEHLKMLYQVASLQSGYGIEEAQEFANRVFGIVKHDLNLDNVEDTIEEEEYLIEEEVEEKAPEDDSEAKEE